jgi:hypothetical protein
VSRRHLLLLAFLLTCVGVTVAVTGGFVTTVSGVRISARSPVPALVLALAFLLTWGVAARRAGAVTSDLAAADRWIVRQSPRLVVAIAILAAGVAARFHSFSATGADASGYLSYAALLLDGALLRPEPLAPIATWADGAATLAPLGWRAALEPGMQVPTYAIGLPLMLAPFHALGGPVAALLVVPLTLAAAVCAVAALAHRLAGSSAALIAAVWLATSPVALIESMQVMSDVPVTAAWLVCWWLVFTSRPLAAGVVAGLAVLIRPNLAPLTIVPALYVVLGNARADRLRQGFGAQEAGARLRPGIPEEQTLPAGPGFSRGMQFSIPVALAGTIVAYLQWRYFGSPFRSGYGTAEEIYAIANIAPNAALYARWLLDSHGPWLFGAPLVLLGPATRFARDSPREIRWLLVFAALVVVVYLIYAVFETWTYLRFMLPALAVAMIAVAAIVAAGLARALAAVRVAGLALAMLALASFNIASARELGVFRFAGHHVRARAVGERLATSLPLNAVIVSGEQSGAMRYYTGRSIVRWDLIDAAAMPTALNALRLGGYQLWMVLDDWEEEPFRRKFPDVAAASIDARPVIESTPGVGVRTRAWTMARLE